MQHDDLKAKFRAIGLALNASNGVVATDDPEATPGDLSWTVDHSSEIDMLNEIEELFSSTDTCPLCGYRSSAP